MKGLLRNNFLAASSNAIVFAGFLLLWGISAVAFPNRAMLIGFGLSGMVGFSANGIFSLQRESAARWAKYKLTLPVKRTDVIKSHYVSQLAWLLVGALFSAAVIGLCWLFHGCPFNLYTDVLLLFGLGISMSLFLCAIFFPLFFWGGEDRGEAFLVIALLCAIALDAGLVALLNLFLTEPGMVTALIGTGALTACSMLAFVLSYPLTAYLYSRKEY